MALQQANGIASLALYITFSTSIAEASEFDRVKRPWIILLHPMGTIAKCKVRRMLAIKAMP